MREWDMRCVDLGEPNGVLCQIARDYGGKVELKYLLQTPEAELMAWAKRAGMVIEDDETCNNGFFWILPQTDDERFEMRMRWDGLGNHVQGD